MGSFGKLRPRKKAKITFVAKKVEKKQVEEAVEKTATKKKTSAKKTTKKKRKKIGIACDYTDLYIDYNQVVSQNNGKIRYKTGHLLF